MPTRVAAFCRLAGVESAGVVATYRKQVQVIRLLLRARGLGAVRVGTVDDYQGQEETALFVSTMYANERKEEAAAERRHPLEELMSGDDERCRFAVLSPPEDGAGEVESSLDCPKRFNVAMSRAKALTVVFGHGGTLGRCGRHWRELIAFCWHRGWYFGEESEATAKEMMMLGTEGNVSGFALGGGWVAGGDAPAGDGDDDDDYGGAVEASGMARLQL